MWRGKSLLKNKILNSVASILTTRSYMFTCSYSTAWSQWMEAEEKRGYSFDDVFNYINKED